MFFIELDVYQHLLYSKKNKKVYGHTFQKPPFFEKNRFDS